MSEFRFWAPAGEEVLLPSEQEVKWMLGMQRKEPARITNAKLRFRNSIESRTWKQNICYNKELVVSSTYHFSNQTYIEHLTVYM